MNFLNVSGIGRNDEKGFELKNINLTQQQFQKIAVTGASGSGKSTLMKIIGGLVQPDSGKVLFEDVRVEGPAEKLIPGHPGVAYLSQHFQLLNNYRVEELLEYANKLSEEEANTLYLICRIDHLLKRKTDQVSGGERQRIALAKQLVTAPKLLLLDEPFSNLDMIHKNILKAVIQDLGEKLGITCMMVLHDPQDSLPWADEIIVMRNGEIIQQGTPEKIYKQPVNEYVAELFGSYNLIDPIQAKVFSKFPDIGLKEQQLFIRPEGFKITTKKTGTLKGVVNKIAYLGNAHEIEVSIKKMTVLVRTNIDNLTKGEEIYLTLSPNDVWFL
ncbi:ABC transporter ATP-binding protein [Chitinophagaceae bacterium LWZ2-11]